jgi:hypothetical protein
MTHHGINLLNEMGKTSYKNTKDLEIVELGFNFPLIFSTIYRRNGHGFLICH